MKAHHLIRKNSGLLKHLRSVNVSMSDIDKLDLYDEYRRLLSEGHKKLYITSYLSDEYNLTERHLYRIINRMERSVA